MPGWFRNFYVISTPSSIVQSLFFDNNDARGTDTPRAVAAVQALVSRESPV